jgi:hypothetical protein
VSSNLTVTFLGRADRTHAILRDAKLAGADLTHTDWSPDAEPSEGWERDTGSGRLRRSAPAAETERNQAE